MQPDARSARGIELTVTGRVFLDHARVILLQVDAAAQAARRAAKPARTAFVLGFLTGLEFDWLRGVMAVLSRSSPDPAAGLMRQDRPRAVAA